jgi:diaminopimelate epimerase
MRLKFTKMQGAGNDFVVLDATRAPIALDAAQWRWLADRRFGVGADQILVVGRPDDAARADFSYRIFNPDGGEVEQCGNGARAFARFVRERGLSDATSIRVETMSGLITPTVEADGTVTVDMGAPRLAPDDVPFDARGLAGRRVRDETLYALEVTIDGAGQTFEFGVLSMGNPHAVTLVDDVATAPVGTVGPRIELHPRFPRRVNVGFLEIVDRRTVRLRVFERGAGETLACGTGACAAVVSGIRRGLLDASVAVHTRGGILVIGWTGAAGDLAAPVTMRGPAATVFEGEVEIPDVEALAATPPPIATAATPAETSMEPQPS